VQSCNFGEVEREASDEAGELFVASVAEAALRGRAADQLLQPLAQREVLDQALERLLRGVLRGLGSIGRLAVRVRVEACQFEIHHLHMILRDGGVGPHRFITGQQKDKKKS